MNKTQAQNLLLLLDEYHACGRALQSDISRLIHGTLDPSEITTNALPEIYRMLSKMNVWVQDDSIREIILEVEQEINERIRSYPRSILEY